MKRIAAGVLRAGVQCNTAARFCSREASPYDSEPIESDARAVYLDAQATQPVDPRCLDKMMPLLLDQFGNPHSRTHEYGWKAEEATEAARDKVCTRRRGDCRL